MCNDPGTSAAFQEGGEVFGTVAGTPVSVGTPGQYQPGITDLAYGLMQQEFALPEQQVAGLTPDQQRAFELARFGVGSFQPFLQQAEGLTAEGVSALRGSLGDTRSLAGQIPGAIAPGQAALGRAAFGAESSATRGMLGADIAAARARVSSEAAQRALQEASGFGLESARAGIAGLAPEAAMSYMNPYEEAVVQRTMDDIARQGRIAQQGLASQAVAAGAFGGSRGQQAQSELQRNILEQQARSVAQLRQSGFESAAGRAMQGAQLTGQLGQIGSGAAASAAEAAWFDWSAGGRQPWAAGLAARSLRYSGRARCAAAGGWSRSGDRGPRTAVHGPRPDRAAAWPAGHQHDAHRRPAAAAPRAGESRRASGQPDADGNAALPAACLCVRHHHRRAVGPDGHADAAGSERRFAACGSWYCSIRLVPRIELITRIDHEQPHVSKALPDPRST
jgi:hypothetical protein